MTPLERTTLVSSGLTRPGRCAGPPAASLAVRYGPRAGRPRPAGRPLMSAAVCPARGGGVLIVLPCWLGLPHASRTDATGFTSFICRIARARHRVKLFGFRACAAILRAAAADRPPGGGQHGPHQRHRGYDGRRG